MTKSSEAACDLAVLDQIEICRARDLANTAFIACPVTMYTSSAKYFAEMGCSFAVLAASTACAEDSAAISWLDSARDRAREAWNNAWYSYSVDECLENLQTAGYASNAYVHLHNARFYMYQCLGNARASIDQEMGRQP